MRDKTKAEKLSALRAKYLAGIDQSLAGLNVHEIATIYFQLQYIDILKQVEKSNE